MSKRTIITIAKRVGVSAATVSRALNNLPGVSETKRRQIQAVAAELDYHPNAIARSLQGKRTNTIAYIAEVENRDAADLFFFKDFITALAVHCARNDIALLIHPSASSDFTMGQVSRIVRSGRADGLILADVRQHDPRLLYLQQQNLLFVAFGRSETSLPYAYVDIDGDWGLFTMTEYLIQRGHRRIAFLGLPDGYSCATHRRDGFRRALREYGLPENPAYMAHGISNGTETRTVMERLLSLPEPPTAFVAASDTLAVHAMEIAAQRGLRAGHDYAITGFDDLPLSAHTNPPLTTMRQPFDQVCDELVPMLQRLVSHQVGPEQILLRPELIVRGSS